MNQSILPFDLLLLALELLFPGLKLLFVAHRLLFPEANLLFWSLFFQYLRRHPRSGSSSSCAGSPPSHHPQGDAPSSRSLPVRAISHPSFVVHVVKLTVLSDARFHGGNEGIDGLKEAKKLRWDGRLVGVAVQEANTGFCELEHDARNFLVGDFEIPRLIGIIVTEILEGRDPENFHLRSPIVQPMRAKSHPENSLKSASDGLHAGS